MYKLAIAFAAYGLVLAILAIREGAMPGAPAGPAQELSLQNLLDSGPGQNSHVVLTDFDFTNRFVYADGRFQSGWRSVWFVVVPHRKGAAQPETEVNIDMTAEFLGGEGGEAPRTIRVPRPMTRLAAAPRRVRALVMSKDLRNENDLGMFVQHHQGRVQGPVTVAEESLSRSDREFLKQRFSGIDLTSCLIIHADAYQRDFVVLVALILGAGFCFVTSGVLFRRGRRQVSKVPATPKPAESKLDPEEEEALYLWQREQHQRRPPSNYV